MIDNLPNVKGSYRFNVDLSKTTWFQVGGRVDVLFRPKDVADLIFFLQNKPLDLKVTILGVGSNVIVKDGGIEGVLIKLGGEFTKITHKDDLVRIGSSCLCYNAAIYSKIHQLSGLEFLTGIPGSIGGAIAMNAGCYDNDISHILISAEAIDFNGNLHTIMNEDFGFRYRGNDISDDLIFLSGLFRVRKGSTKEISNKIDSFNKRRELSQPIRSKTGGSTFKNIKDIKAWELIDKAGCRGMCVGDAKISEKHCNFMINTNNAKAQDLIDLGNKVKNLVKEKTGFELEWEIKTIGRD